MCASLRRLCHTAEVALPSHDCVSLPSLLLHSCFALEAAAAAALICYTDAAATAAAVAALAAAVCLPSRGAALQTLLCTRVSYSRLQLQHMLMSSWSRDMDMQWSQKLGKAQSAVDELLCNTLQSDTKQRCLSCTLALCPRAALLVGAVRGTVRQVHVQPPVPGLQVHRPRLLRALQ
jgi:hypothetical protein